MAMVEIRVAKPNDAEEIAVVLREAFGMFEKRYTAEAFEIVTPSIDEIIRRFDDGPQWVAVLNAEIVGTVSIMIRDECLYLYSVAVRPSAQGKGVGHKLLDATDEYAAKTDFDRIFLYSTYFTPGAKELYEKHGYKWVRDTPAEEWFGVAGLEMDKTIERKKQNVVGS